MRACSIDWLRLSGPASKAPEVIAHLASRLGEPKDGPGRYFLHRSVRWDGASGVCFDEEHAHCVVELGGSVLARLSMRERVELLAWLACHHFKGCRIDIALDLTPSGAGFIKALHEESERGALCRVRTWRMHVGRSSGRINNEGIEFGRRGSMGSGRFVRVYDKGLEQGTEPRGKWVRWESEYAGDCAAQVCLTIAEVVEGGGDWEACVRSFALGGMEFREPSATAHGSLQRRRMCEWFAELVAAVGNVAVRAVRVRTHFEGFRRWLKRSVEPSLVTMSRESGMPLEQVLRFLLGRPGKRGRDPRDPVVVGFRAALGLAPPTWEPARGVA